MTVRLWIDTDIGDNPDDTVALLAAAAHPLVEIGGISTVSGDVVARAELAGEVLRTCGAADVLRFAGAPDPRALEACDAVLAIGPLSNLAALVRAGVELPPVAVMGGARSPVLHRGQLRETDSNFGADPFAAAVVVAGTPELLIVPLDVTARMVLSGDETAELAGASAVLREAIDAWHTRAGPAAQVCLHDPLALLAVCGEPVVTIGAATVGVDARGRIVDSPDAGRPCDIVVAVDRDAAVDRVLELVAGLPQV